MKTIGLFFETNCEFGREFLRGVAQYAHERRDWRLKLMTGEAVLPQDANLNSPIQPKDLAKVAGVSQTSLQKAIRKLFGVSAGKYILEIKMRRAIDLLEADGTRIKEVATAMGFSSPSHFCHAFKRHFGHPPSLGK